MQNCWWSLHLILSTKIIKLHLKERGQRSKHWKSPDEWLLWSALSFKAWMKLQLSSKIITVSAKQYTQKVISFTTTWRNNLFWNWFWSQGSMTDELLHQHTTWIQIDVPKSELSDGSKSFSQCGKFWLPTWSFWLYGQLWCLLDKLITHCLRVVLCL